MKLFLNRLRISSKRCFLNPYIYGMAVILIALAVLCVAIPEREASAYIPVSILNLDDSEDTEAAVDELCRMNSVFEFYEVDSEEQMYAEIASGKCNTGIIIPEDLMDRSANLHRMPKIRVITTPSSTLPLMSSEETFMKLFPHFALRVLTASIDGQDNPFPEDYHEAARRILDEYLHSNAIYRLEDLENTEYNEITTSKPVPIPIYKFSGFFIWMAALLGALSFLNDCDNKLYLRMRKGERFLMGLVLPAVHVVPVMVLSVICMIVAGVEYDPVHLILYSLAVILISFIVAAIVVALPGQSKRSSLFAAVLPTYLILSFLFGGVLINLSVYSPILRTCSMFFPPYFF